MTSFVQNKPSLSYFMRESTKKALKPLNRNLSCNVKHMTMNYNSNQLNTIIYTKECSVLSFLQKEQSLSYFLHESAKKSLKPLKSQFTT